MKILFAALALGSATAVTAAPHPFNAHDLAMMDRVSDPHLSSDRSHVVFGVRSTDYAANKGISSVWLLDTAKAGTAPERVTDGKSNANAGRFSQDGKTLYFLANDKDSVGQLWSLPVAGGEQTQVTHLPVDIDNYRISPDGKSLLFSAQVFEDCADLACTKSGSTRSRPTRPPVASTIACLSATGIRGLIIAVHNCSSCR